MALPVRVTLYEDGCHVHPECLSCPLPRCIYDGPASSHAEAVSARLEERARAADAARLAGLTLDEIAERLGVSRRTVARALRLAAELTEER